MVVKKKQFIGYEEQNTVFLQMDLEARQVVRVKSVTLKEEIIADDFTKQ